MVTGVDRLGFSGSTADVNRFAARYRAAKCFSRVEFEELTAATADGYSSLVQLLLSYSAFEHFLRCIGTTLKQSHALLRDAERDGALVKLRSLQGQAALFSNLHQHLGPQYQRQVDAHLKNGACNPFYLAAGIRHAFAHGILTASPGNIPQQSVATVCRFLSRVLFRVMDREFGSRMDSFEEGLARVHKDG
jgi:hypothetical protein